MQCFTELTPPTAVTHSLCFPFISSSSNNLIVARTSLLQIFTLKTISVEVDTSADDPTSGRDNLRLNDRRMLDSEGLEQSFLAADVTLQRAERAHNTKLLLIAEYALPGTVTSLARIKTLHSRSEAEALLVATKDAKVSLVEWDPERHAISTISIHFYEREDLQGSPWAPDLGQCVSYLTVDPSSRCAALKFGARNLAILPFHQPGDDLVMGDYDPDLDGDPPSATLSSSKPTGTEAQSSQTPYASSFVLPLSALDSNLIHPIHLAFLHEYREPTFGILSSPLATSCSLLHERRDLLSYTVFTLDLEQRASTTILSVTDLPYDLHRVIPLPTPVGGALLVGANELIHVDQAGKTNGVAVNMFAKEGTSFGMADQSDLKLRLEGCVMEQLGVENGELLMVTTSGELVVVSFRLDGRSVSGLTVRRVSKENGGLCVQAAASCSASLGRGRIFVGSEDADSVVLGWSRKSKQQTKQRGATGPSNEEVEDEAFFDADDADDYDDDLYSGDQTNGRQPAASLSSNSKLGDYSFRIHDSLFNLGPMTDVSFGRPILPASDKDNSKDVDSNLELVTSTGRSRAGGLTVLNRAINPHIIGRFDFPEATGLWSLRAKRPVSKTIVSQTTAKSNADLDSGYGLEEFDSFLIVSSLNSQGSDESAVYAVSPTGFEEMKDTEFDPNAGETVDAGALGDGNRVVQVLKGEIRSYDGDLGLAQIFPMTDEATGAEPKAVSASFADPYLLVIRDDASIMVLECDSNGDLEELERGDGLLKSSWTSGSLYNDHDCVFDSADSKNGVQAKQKVVMSLLNAEGDLYMYNLPDLTRPIYAAASVSTLPPVIAPDYTAKRSSTKEALSEVLLADLGDSVARSPYLVMRGADDDLTIYEPFFSSSNHQESIASTLRFLKVLNTQTAQSPETSTEQATGNEQTHQPRPLRAVSDIGGYSVIFLPGIFPSFVIKSAASMPKMLSLRGKAVKGMGGFHTAGCDKGWVYVDIQGVVRVAQLPLDAHFAEIGWATKRVPLGEEVHNLSYHEATNSYVLGTSDKVEFELPKDDEVHREWADEDIPFKPLVEQGYIKLLSPVKWSIIDTHELNPYEIVLCVKTISLEVSEKTRTRKPLIVIGTSLNRVVDQASRGCIYIFDIIPVVPEPGRPETDRKLKLIAREEVKGAVTAVSEVGTQGFLLAAQGQKCMVRGLTEDGSLLPVAFMDVMCHVSAMRCLPRTGLCVLGDAVKGLWLVGYSEDPYKMTLFGKSAIRLEVMAADFLPHEDQLFLIVADAECNLHVLQFDPEHPKSLSGMRLLHHTIFYTGLYPSTLTRVPSSSPHTSHQTLLTSTAGSLSLITPVSETVYRRLSALTSALSATLEQPCGLNARAYRIGGSGNATEGVVGRGMLDGSLLRRWTEIGLGRRIEMANRVGLGADEVRADLEKVGIIGSDGLAYL